ncbi:hypothetical protein C8Q80DRAFT_1122494 [Daedaleopsis nitida]|nr:hypothetical protein C8Q80DRAFT_1122494 [Daedaleopsis nitida]
MIPATVDNTLGALLIGKCIEIICVCICRRTIFMTHDPHSESKVDRPILKYLSWVRVSDVTAYTWYMIVTPTALLGRSPLRVTEYYLLGALCPFMILFNIGIYESHVCQRCDRSRNLLLSYLENEPSQSTARAKQCESSRKIEDLVAHYVPLSSAQATSGTDMNLFAMRIAKDAQKGQFLIAGTTTHQHTLCSDAH